MMEPWLSGELSDAQAVFGTTRSVTATHQRSTPGTLDQTGVESDPSWSTVGSVVIRRLSDMGFMAQETVAGGQAYLQRWEITLPPGYDIRELDRLVVGPATYTVTNVLPRDDNLELERLVWAQLEKP